MPYKHITINEREKISHMLIEKISLSEIAHELGRSKSTISREIRRNIGKSGYRTLKAQSKAEKWRYEAKQPYKMMDPRINTKVIDALEQDWSPEQIASIIKRDYPDDVTLHISHQTIYAWIQQDKLEGGMMYMHLRQSNRKRRKRYGSGTSKRGHIKNAKDITERPAIVEKLLNTRPRKSLEYQTPYVVMCKLTGVALQI